MQIIIPMSGEGRRFLNAGYTLPKPLIKVDGKPTIEHVINLFPPDTKFTFICNNDHLTNTRMKKILTSLAPDAKISGIEKHKKGPVYAVSQAFDLIEDNDEVIVNYCDFSKYWDYQDFLTHTRSRGADGAISAYKGFHPHMLKGDNYAFIKEQDQWLIEIQEKKPFTQNKMNEYASDGTYYFKSGGLLKACFEELMKKDIAVNGEYYVSMVYNLLVEGGSKVSIYEIQHMLQWGTPEDLEEYQQWSDYFKAQNKQKKIAKENKSLNLIPLAGRGSRFTERGYTEPKPLIKVSAKPMVIQAAHFLPDAEKIIFVCLAEHLDKFALKKELLKTYNSAKIVKLDSITKGQACTCEMGLMDEDPESPLFIAASDNLMLWDTARYKKLINEGTDCIAWSFRHNTASERNPHMYGWIKVDEDNNIKGVSVKVPISDNPREDHAIIGAFYFKKTKYFIDALKRMYEKKIKVNDEFYVDSCIDQIIGMNLNAKVFEVDHYICLGTPDDFQTYEYWQSFFHKCEWHPYSLKEDPIMDKEKLGEYDKRYRSFEQPNT